MGKEILVNVANRETRIAVLEDNQLVELRVEREEQVVGNIYKGRVENVLPGMDAAFVDIGLERNAFLYVADILPEYVDSDDEEDDDDEVVEEAGAEIVAAAEPPIMASEPAAATTEQVAIVPPAAAAAAARRRRRGGRSGNAKAAAVADLMDTADVDPAVDDFLNYLSDPERDDADDESDGHLAVEAFGMQGDAAEVVLGDDEAEESDAEDVAEEAELLFEANSPHVRVSLPVDEDPTPLPVSDDLAGALGEEAPGEEAARSEVKPKRARAPRRRSPRASIETESNEIGQAKRPPRRTGRPNRGPRRHVPIQELVQPRQELMLQVVKGPRGTKGSRVSTRMSLPGRYLVLMPDANNLGVSRKIEEAKERDRLKSAVEKFRQQNYGIIVRTEAEGRSISELYQDYTMLVETWQNVWNKAKTTPAPGLIHRDQSLIYTIMRDVFGSDIDRLIIDSPEDYARACEIIDRISPDLSDRIHLYDGAKPLFENFKVEDDIERLLRRKVWLKSGGYLVIDQTEALTSIDVNTGKFIGSTGLSETIFHTNMEATNEIARQLRLRDIGGMIILDFIDMDNQRDKKMVTDTLFKALKNDRSRTKISSISPLGLIEMTRKRTKETVDVAMTDTCPYCHGIGRISSAETVSMSVEREIAKLANEVNTEAILVIAHPDVVAQLIGEQGEDIDLLERQVRRSVYVRAQPHFHMEKFEVEPGAAGRIEQSYPMPKRGQVVECSVLKSTLSALPWATAYVEGGFQVEIANGGKFLGQNIKVRLKTVGRSYAVGDTVSGGSSNAAQRPRNPQVMERGRPTGAGR